MDHPLATVRAMEPLTLDVCSTAHIRSLPQPGLALPESRCGAHLPRLPYLSPCFEPRFRPALPHRLETGPYSHVLPNVDRRESGDNRGVKHQLTCNISARCGCGCGWCRKLTSSSSLTEVRLRLGRGRRREGPASFSPSKAISRLRADILSASVRSRSSSSIVVG